MTQNAAAAENGGVAPEEAEVSLWSVVVRRAWLLALTVPAALGLGYLYATFFPTLYQSKAQVLVFKKRPDMVPGVLDRSGAMEEYLATQAGIIESPLVAERAIREGELAPLQTFASSSDRTADLIRKLKVKRDTRDRTNNILDVSFSGLDPDEAQKILSSIIQSYQKFLRENYQNASNETLKLIVQAKDTVVKDLAKKEAEYREFRKKHPSLVLTGKTGSNMNNELLLSLYSKRLALQVRRAEVEGLLNSIEKGEQPGKHENLMALVYQLSSRAVQESGGRQQSQTLEDKLLAPLIEEQGLLAEFAPTHPQVMTARKKVELTNAVVVAILKLDLTGIKTAEQSLARLFETQNAEAQSMGSDEVEDELVRSDITRLQLLADNTIKRLQEVDVMKDLGGYEAQVIGPPTAGELALQSNPLLIYPGAAVAGLVASMGLIVILPVSRRKGFQSPHEIRARLGWPVVGYVPIPRGGREAGTGLSAALSTYYRPDSPEAEAYRGVRTALLATAAEGHKVLEVAGLESGNGGSTLAANLAVSLAQSGRRVLLIDADLRRPRVHRLFGLNAQVGLATVLAQVGEASAAIQPTPVADLSVLPSGPAAANAAELLASARLKSLLDSLREQYDFVVIDVPPVLAVCDAAVVAIHADGVLLTMRPNKSTPEQAARAKELLEAAHATVLGVVINVRDGHGGYGEQSYRAAR